MKMKGIVTVEYNFNFDIGPASIQGIESKIMELWSIILLRGNENDYFKNVEYSFTKVDEDRIEILFQGIENDEDQK